MSTTRRQWLIGAAATIVFTNSGASSRTAQASEPFFRRRQLPLGLQLYTLSERATADLAGTLTEVAAIGYRTIELAGYYGRTPTQLRRAIDSAGLRCPSAHIPGKSRGNGEPSLDGDLAALAADAHVLGVDTIVMPTFLFPEAGPARSPGETSAQYMARVGDRMTVDDWKRNAAFLNRVGTSLASEGLRFAYHNHNAEFAPLTGDNTGMAILLRETDAHVVSFEMDAGWVTAAGQDPIALLRGHPGRFRQMHVKDILSSTRTNYAFRQDPTQVGQGIIDWKHILPVAYAAGVRQFYVEQEPPFSIDRLAAVRASYRYLASLETA